METLLDFVAKQAGTDTSLKIVDEGVNTTPELTTFPARQVTGTSYFYLRHKEDESVVAPFRKANQGTDESEDDYERVLAQMYMLSKPIICDKLIAEADLEGPERHNERKGVNEMRRLARGIAHQVWYGDDASSDGFAGIQKTIGTTLASNGGRVILSDTTSAANNTSVYLVRYGVDDGVSFDMGNNSSLDVSEFKIESVQDAKGKKFQAYIAYIAGWLGLRIATAESVMRIANVRTEAGKKGLSDEMIAEAISYWKGAPPNAIWMNRRAAWLLQKSRNVTTMQGPTGKVSSTIGPFAPSPTESQNIPIVITDALTNTEAFVA